MAKRKVKSEVSVRVKQTRKGKSKGEPIVATVRIGQPKRRGTSVAERLAKPVLAPTIGRTFGAPSDFAITAGFRNIENQQQNLFRALEEQRKNILDITQNTGQLMAERAGLRTLRRVGEPAYSGQSSVAEFAPTGSNASTAPSKLLIDVPNVLEERKVQKWVMAQREVIERDPRVVPSIISEPVDIEELAPGEEAETAPVGEQQFEEQRNIMAMKNQRARLGRELGLTTQEIFDFETSMGRLPTVQDFARSVVPPEAEKRGRGRPRKEQ
jgi:hypothetical protein